MTSYVDIELKHVNHRLTRLYNLNFNVSEPLSNLPREKVEVSLTDQACSRDRFACDIERLASRGSLIAN